MIKTLFKILILIPCSLSCSISDYSESLSGDYIFVSESSVNQAIVLNGYKDSSANIPCTVISHVFNEDFIIAAQVENLNCFDRDLSGKPIFFWILYHRDKRVIGPLELNEYIKTRRELNIPQDLKLKIHL